MLYLQECIYNIYQKSCDQIIGETIFAIEKQVHKNKELMRKKT
jgi:hypothetical protein